MKGFLSIVSNEENKYSSVFLSTLNDEIKFDKGDLLLDWYDYVKHIINNMILEVSHNQTIFNFLDNNRKYEMRYFSVEFEEFLTKKEYLETSYLDKKSLMRVIVLKKMKTFHEYKEYITMKNLKLEKIKAKEESNENTQEK